jgi:hypothetical protein
MMAKAGFIERLGRRNIRAQFNVAHDGGAESASG